MIRGAWRRIVRFLSSAILAIALLVILGVWSMVATLVPQGAASATKVAAWASAHPVLEPIVRAVGLHAAFSNPVFIAVVIALGVCTALCAWQRTKAALHRARRLRDAARTDGPSLAGSHDFEVVCADALSAPEALSVASQTLTRLGVRTRRRDEVLVGVSPWWTVWGSSIFHWALLGLILIILVGNMLRSEGLMGVAVGETKADAPQSYGVLFAGPLHDWGLVHRAIRVDAFEPQFNTGGVDRGPTPTVSLLDGAGKVIKTQRVYPNMTLKSGSLTIYPSAYGLAAVVSSVDTSGVVKGQGLQLMDFSVDASGGTVPIGGISVIDASGKPTYRATLTVPLDREGGGFRDQVPRKPAARVVVSSLDGKTVLDQALRPGDKLVMPGALDLRLDGIVYYARLQVVDDWTIPLIYAGLVVALVGLSMATLARQQIVLATVVEGPDGPRIVAKVRLWRNSSSSRSEIEDELTKALSEAEKGSAS